MKLTKDNFLTILKLHIEENVVVKEEMDEFLEDYPDAIKIVQEVRREELDDEVIKYFALYHGLFKNEIGDMIENEWLSNSETSDRSITLEEYSNDLIDLAEKYKHVYSPIKKFIEKYKSYEFSEDDDKYYEIEKIENDFRKCL